MERLTGKRRTALRRPVRTQAEQTAKTRPLVSNTTATAGGLGAGTFTSLSGTAAATMTTTSTLSTRDRHEHALPGEPPTAYMDALLAFPGRGGTTAFELRLDPTLTAALHNARRDTPEGRLFELAYVPLRVHPQLDPGAAVVGANLRKLASDQHLQHLSPREAAIALAHPEWEDALAKSGMLDTGRGPEPHFLLAAALSSWMDGMYSGARRDEVADAFLAAHPTIAARFPDLDGTFLGLLQKTYPFMPQWARKPTPSPMAAPGVSAKPDLRAVGDPAQAKLEELLGKLAEVPLRLSLSARIGDELSEKKPFAGHNVVMVQHMLGQAVPFLDEMVRGGLDPEKAEYVGVPYQENAGIRLALERCYGIEVTVPPRGDIDAMWQHVGAAIDRAVEKHGRNGEPILVIDDGGYASRHIAERYPDRQHLFRVVEQTTRGLTEISTIPNVGFPVVNVAGSHGKRFESAQVGDVVVHAIRKVLDSLTTTPTRKDVLIVGAGKVGAAVATSFKGDGARVSIFDPFIGAKRKKELEAQGFTVITDKMKALDKKFLVVGCSGHRSIDMSDFAKLSSPVFLASSSSKRVEIDTIGLQDLARDDEGTLRRILAAKVGEQETFHYWLKDGRIVTAMADGLPINFQGVNSIAPEAIDHTMALMLLGAAQAVSPKLKDRRGLVELDHLQQARIQLAMEGMNGEKRAEGDIGVFAFDQAFYGTHEQWLSIAQSPATPPELLDALYRLFIQADPMHPICLECLSSAHDISLDTIADVAKRGVLPHIARLLVHETLPKGEQDRLLSSLGLAVIDLETQQYMGTVASSYTAIDVDARDQPRRHTLEHLAYRFVKDEHPSFTLRDMPLADPGNPFGEPDAAARINESTAVVRAHLLGLLLTHERCPPQIASALAAHLPTRVGTVSTENVLALSAAPMAAGQLERLFALLLPTLQKIPGDKNVVGADGEHVSPEARARYVYDMLDAFARHPGATLELQAKVSEKKHALQRFVGQSVALSGHDSWPMSSLGIRLPEYL